jgi:hypothetical protein
VWEAITQIASAIQSATASTDNEQRTAAGDTYLTMLDEHDSLLAKASTRGLQSHEQDDEQNEGIEENIDGEARSKHSHSRSASPESKWRKVDKSLYAWNV